jgi:hypothetical protein
MRGEEQGELHTSETSGAGEGRRTLLIGFFGGGVGG